MKGKRKKRAYTHLKSTIKTDLKMTQKIKIFILSLLIGITTLDGFSQKLFYSPKTADWKNSQPDSSLKIDYSIYLIGDLKHPDSTNKVLELLEKQMKTSGDKSSVVVLGDILYQRGLIDSTDANYNEALKKLNFILSKFNNYKGQTIIIPGNHDWAQGREEGWKNIKNQENYIEKALNKGNVFLPDGGCPGPVEVHLNEEIVIIAFDYQWWLHRHKKPHPVYQCGWDKDADFFVLLKDAIRNNAHKQIIIASHFPLYSVGNHGGYFPTENSIFPLLERKKWMYIPLPGFIYTGYRKFFGSIQDLAHPDYRALRDMIWNIIAKYPNVIYAAGHEHNLQYLFKNNIHHIISGGGGEGTYISRRKKKADFAAASEGYCRLDFYENGDVWAKFLKPSAKGFSTLFQKKLFNKSVLPKLKNIDYNKNYNFSDSTVFKSLTDIYEADPSKKFWMGENYRKEWNTKVSYPVFDIGKEKGGLSIIKRGGGMQTTSVRLEDKNGNQFVLRSVNKNVEKALDKFMHHTFIQDIVQDGISASHPFAAITIPDLAEAAGIYHTKPHLVWVPDDPRLGIYRKDLANNVFLFEERPTGNADHIKNFGNSQKIISTLKVIEKTQNNQDHSIDQKAVLKARLFDILINDWDRHDDQWRWASFKEADKTIYKPIPRDRDQVYFVNEGLLMWLISRDFMMPKFQGFDYQIKNVKGLGFNARFFDRSFLTEPNREDWINEAKLLQHSISNTVINKAINQLPPEIYKISGDEIKAKLKSRRDKLVKYTGEYYDFLSKKVDIVGTNDRDYFNIERFKNGDVLVNVYELSEKKAKIKDLKYQRKFDHKVTKEIRLYGLGDKDKFDISGKSRKGIKLRLIGGKGRDEFNDSSNVKGPSRKNLIYDRSDKKNSFDLGRESKLQLSDDKSVNEYNRRQFKYNKSIPLILLGFNIDDGVFLGGGILLKQYNFRDSTLQKISGRYAYKTNAFSIKYKGVFSSIFRKSNLQINAEFSIPRNVDNFFGMGNQSNKEFDEKNYYSARYRLVWINPMIAKALSKKVDLSYGIFYKHIQLSDTAGKFVGSLYPDIFEGDAYKEKNYLGASVILDIDNRNNKINPTRGTRWVNEAHFYGNVNGQDYKFLKLKTDLSFYMSFERDPRFVFALRFGGARNIGDYDFFHANYLGGKNNLRGFLSHRFAGDSYLYQNTEIRIKLLNIRKHFFVGEWGILAFNDIGKVWIDGEKSTKWHNGYGFGTWISPFNATIINLTYSMSSEERRIVSFNISFSF